MIKLANKNAERIRRHKRVRNVVNGTPECPRLNVFRSNANIYAQVIDDTTGTTLCAVSSLELKLENGGNIEAAKKVGTAIANKLRLKQYVSTVAVMYIMEESRLWLMQLEKLA